jgi:hypothetical protein
VTAVAVALYTGHIGITDAMRSDLLAALGAYLPGIGIAIVLATIGVILTFWGFRE